MILETYCHACERGMPAILWGFHKWWYGCPGKTPSQHDRENGLVYGMPIDEVEADVAWSALAALRPARLPRRLGLSGREGLPGVSDLQALEAFLRGTPREDRELAGALRKLRVSSRHETAQTERIRGQVGRGAPAWDPIRADPGRPGPRRRRRATPLYLLLRRTRGRQADGRAERTLPAHRQVHRRDEGRSTTPRKARTRPPSRAACTATARSSSTLSWRTHSTNKYAVLERRDRRIAHVTMNVKDHGGANTEVNLRNGYAISIVPYKWLGPSESINIRVYTPGEIKAGGLGVGFEDGQFVTPKASASAIELTGRRFLGDRHGHAAVSVLLLGAVISLVIGSAVAGVAFVLTGRRATQSSDSASSRDS